MGPLWTLLPLFVELPFSDLLSSAFPFSSLLMPKWQSLQITSLFSFFLQILASVVWHDVHTGLLPNGIFGDFSQKLNNIPLQFSSSCIIAQAELVSISSVLREPSRKRRLLKKIVIICFKQLTASILKYCNCWSGVIWFVLAENYKMTFSRWGTDVICPDDQCKPEVLCDILRKEEQTKFLGNIFSHFTVVQLKRWLNVHVHFVDYIP